MNGYRATRLTDEEIPEALILALGLDKETPGLVMVDLIMPKHHGAYRFTARQFHMFCGAVMQASDMAGAFSMVIDCFSSVVADEDKALIDRLMARVGDYIADMAERAGGEDMGMMPPPDDEAIPFDEL